MIEKIYGSIRELGHKNSSYTDCPVHGFDTETPNYKIRLMSISDGSNSNLYDVDANTILDIFLEHFDKVKAKRIILFAHNLKFDFTVLMNLDLQDENFRQLAFRKECSWKYAGCEIRFFNTTPYFGTIRYPNRKVIELRDTFSWFDTIKLSELSEAMKVGVKLKIDNEDFYHEGIHRDIKFREYAKVDALITARIGGKIMDFHSMNDIKPCVSGPQMAMAIMRKDYLRKGEVLTNPPERLMGPFELSYHGGKNGCYFLSPSEHENIHIYDINSAYPFAMTQIPSFVNCRYQVKENINKFDPKETGIYRINALSRCKYNSSFDHDFTPLKTLRNIWVTSYELKTLIDYDCFDKLDIDVGIFIKERSDRNPIGEYAKAYYKLKNITPKESPLYLFYKKTMLNSLYGKFIERRYDDQKDYSIRGSNYNPAIATLITGHTRAYLHSMEHNGNAIHSATDSVFTKNTMHTSRNLGGVSEEGYGRLQMFRNKVYLFWSKKKPKKGEIIKNKHGEYLLKYAYHGFHGTVKDLIYIWNNRGKPKNEKFKGKNLKTNEYIYEKMPTPGEFFIHKKLNLRMYGMNKMKATLNVDWRNLNVK